MQVCGGSKISLMYTTQASKRVKILHTATYRAFETSKYFLHARNYAPVTEQHFALSPSSSLGSNKGVEREVT